MNNSKKIVLGFQHLFAMFGATVLVPALTGLNASVALICAGAGTLIFHFVTKNKVPVFLGSSFSFIGALCIVINNDPANIPKAQGGIIAAGCIYLILSFIVRVAGAERVRSFFPAIVTGPVIAVIGLNLAPIGITGAATNWWIAIIVLLLIISFSVFAKGFFKLVPILIGLVGGYAACIAADLLNLFPEKLINYQPILDASWINPIWDFSGFFTLPVFDLAAITLIAPIAFVTFMEHIGDITTNGSVVGKDFFKDPGLHRTLLGDGLATILAGFVGGPANTTYSENTGVLAVTKVYDTAVLKLAAIFAIMLGIIGKFGGVLVTIPESVKGAMSIILFGMIAAVGIRTLAEAKLDFAHSRNLLIIALILVLGLGLSSGIVIGDFTISGLFIAVVVGAAANKILPENV